MSTLPRVLFSRDLPEAELQAARLDQELYRLAEAYCPIDEIELPEHRAVAALGDRSSRFIGELSTASWIWGAIVRLPAMLEFCTELDARARLAPSRRVAVRELVLDPADVVRLGPVRVVTPLRAAVELARFRSEWGADQIAEVAALASIGGFDLDEALALMNRRPNLHAKRRAAQRLGLSLN